ncbi:MAG: hypothetical protein ACOYJG_05115 [Prevotella sp.]|jgi:hypothetical protein
MNKNLTKCLSLLFVALVTTCMPVAAQSKRFVKGSEEASKIQKWPASVIGNSKSYANQQIRNSSSLSTTDVLVDEDFSGFTEGTEDNPDTTELYCQYGLGKYEGLMIDPKYTKRPGWMGTEIYSAGGTVGLFAHQAWLNATMNTPQGDYSGDLTITLRAKVPSKTPGSSAMVYVRVCKGGFEDPTAADCENQEYNTSVMIYGGPQASWTEITFKVRNYSADSDGFIQISVMGKALIDDVKVTSTTDDFLAPPKLRSVTDFNKDGSFTLHWDYTRKAYDYRIKLYKAEKLSEGDSIYTEHFDDLLPDGTGMAEGFSATGNSTNFLSENEGVDGTEAFVFHDGDTLTTYNLNAKYQDFSFWTACFYPDTVAPEEDYESVLTMEGLTGDGWTKLGDIYLNMFLEYTGTWTATDIWGSDEYKNQYYALRFSLHSPYPDARLIFDDVMIETSAPIGLTEVEPNSQYGKTCGYINTKNNYLNVYEIEDDNTTPQQCYADLDPNATYFYQVGAHYMYQVAWTAINEIVGLSTPVVTPATNIDERGSYTANWEKTPKAEGYVVSNYGVTVLDEDEPGFTLLSEDFSKIDETMTTKTSPTDYDALSNTASYMDDYTEMPGWIGLNNAICQDMMGGAAAQGSWAYLQTPTLWLNNDSTFSVRLKVYGTKDDYLVIATTNAMYTIQFPENTKDTLSTGLIEGTLQVKQAPEATPLMFYTYGESSFMMDYIEVTQDLKAGDKTYTYLGYGTTSDTTYTFTGLSDYGFEMYAYNVVAWMQHEGETIYSLTSPFAELNIDPTGIEDASLDDETVEGNVKLIGIYTIDGRKVNEPVKGINILKYSNGKTVKRVFK